MTMEGWKQLGWNDKGGGEKVGNSSHFCRPFDQTAPPVQNAPLK